MSCQRLKTPRPRICATPFATVGRFVCAALLAASACGLSGSEGDDALGASDTSDATETGDSGDDAGVPLEPGFFCGRWNTWLHTSNEFEYADGPQAVLERDGDILIAGTRGVSAYDPVARNAAYLTRYDANGEREWMSYLHAPPTTINGEALAANDETIVMLGEADGPYDEQPHPAAFRPLIASFDARGELIDAYSTVISTVGAEAGNPYGTYTTDLALGPDGSVFVAGFSSGVIAPNPVPDGDAGYIVKYDSRGERQWATQFDTPDAGTYARAIAYLPSTGGIAALSFEDAYNPYDNHSSLRRFDAEGLLEFMTKLPAPLEEAWQLVHDPGSGDFVVAGQTASYPDQRRMWLGRYDAQGNERWTREFDTGGADQPSALTLDAAGNVYVAAITAAALPGLANGGDDRDPWDMYLLALDPSGELLWADQLEAPGDQRVHDMAFIESTGQLVLVGRSEAALFNSEPAVGDEEAHGFVMGYCAPA